MRGVFLFNTYCLLVSIYLMKTLRAISKLCITELILNEIKQGIRNLVKKRSHKRKIRTFRCKKANRTIDLPWTKIFRRNSMEQLRIIENSNCRPESAEVRTWWKIVWAYDNKITFWIGRTRDLPDWEGIVFCSRGKRNLFISIFVCFFVRVCFFCFFLCVCLW